jgi:predicted permease
MGIPIKMGRGLTDRDDAQSPKVVVINETAAKQFFPDQNPLGQHFGSSRETTGQLEIVGVLRDAKYDSVRDTVPPTMYVPYRQTRVTGTVFEVRTAAAPAGTMGAIREAARQIDPNLPLTDVSTQLETIERRFVQEKLFAQAYSLFGGLALLLAAIGLFGLMSYNVSRRTNEIGIRMALGAQRRDVLGMVMRESMLLVAIGVVAGVATAIAASKLVTTLLFGLPPRDPGAIIAATAVMLAVSLLAGFLPARRASRVDPMVALHYE